MEKDEKLFSNNKTQQKRYQVKQAMLLMNINIRI